MKNQGWTKNSKYTLVQLETTSIVKHAERTAYAFLPRSLDLCIKLYGEKEVFRAFIEHLVDRTRSAIRADFTRNDNHGLVTAYGPIKFFRPKDLARQIVKRWPELKEKKLPEKP